MSGPKKRSYGVSPILKKNNTFFDTYLSDLKKDGSVEDVFVGRILKTLGNGRMDVFYVDGDTARTTKATIRGLFRGKGKHSVGMGTNSIVLIADSGIHGASQYEIVCLLSADQIRDLRKFVELDHRILAMGVTDDAVLISNTLKEGDGIEFIGVAEEEEDVDVDTI